MITDRGGKAQPTADRSLLTIGLSGLNAWAVTAMVPFLNGGFDGVGRVFLWLSPLPLLALGLFLVSRRPEPARWLLLAGYPASLGFTIAATPEAIVWETWRGPTTVIAAAAISAFVLATAHTTRRPPSPWSVQSKPLTDRSSVVTAHRGRRARLSLLVIAFAGATLLTLGPAVGEGRESFMRAWGPAAAEGASLAALIGALTASIALGVVVAPRLRARSERSVRQRRGRRKRRLLFALAVGTASALAWWALELSGRD